MGANLAERESITYGGLEARASARASTLCARGLGGRRVILLKTTGLEFLVNIFAVWATGGTAIPLSQRLLLGASEGLRLVLDDAAPGCILGDEALAARLGRQQPGDAITVEVVDSLGESINPNAGPFAGVESKGLAVIQYTSGSTSQPKGVGVTHANLLANAEMLRDAFEGGPQDVAVCWLPLFHDMGLMSGLILPVVMGASSVLMEPAGFAARPGSWLAAISQFGGTVSAGPNFAYQACVDRVGDDDAADLDLSAWRVAMCGAEPVRADTVQMFCNRFRGAGFDSHSFIPSYGLAEATLFVSGGPRRGPRIVERNVSKEGEIRPRELVSCGAVAPGQEVLIVDPVEHQVLSDGSVGEIWVRGPNTAAGYFNNPQETARTFAAKLANESDGQAGHSYLRTGDLGFFDLGELVVVGRLKDVMIVRGVKHHPEDLELTCSRSHPDLANAPGVAFAVNEGERNERVVVIHEVRRAFTGDVTQVTSALRAAVAQHHGLTLDAIVLAPYKTLPLTSSGKVRRAPTRAAWLEGTLMEMARWENRTVKSN